MLIATKGISCHNIAFPEVDCQEYFVRIFNLPIPKPSGSKDPGGYINPGNDLLRCNTIIDPGRLNSRVGEGGRGEAARRCPSGHLRPPDPTTRCRRGRLEAPGRKPGRGAADIAVRAVQFFISTNKAARIKRSGRLLINPGNDLLSL